MIEAAAQAAFEASIPPTAAFPMTWERLDELSRGAYYRAVAVVAACPGDDERAAMALLAVENPKDQYFALEIAEALGCVMVIRRTLG